MPHSWNDTQPMGAGGSNLGRTDRNLLGSAGAYGTPEPIRTATLRLLERANQQEWRYQALIEAISDGVVVCYDGCIEEVNRSALAIMGHSKEACQGQSLATFFEVDARRIAQSGVRGERRCTIGYRVSGQQYPATIELGGKLPGGRLLLVLRDQTEAFRVVQAWEKAQQTLAEIEDIKSSLVNNVSHELRTPLTILRGYLSLMREALPSDEQECMAAIEEGCTRLQNQIGRLLDFSALQRGALHVTPSRVAIHDLVEAVASRWIERAKAKGLSMSVELAAPCEAFVDPDAAGQVIESIVGNAVRFTDRGHVTVRVSPLGEQVRVEVADTGPGMSNAFMQQAFDAFSQQSRGLTRSHDGLGLGLTLARGLLDMMQGSIDIQSRPGEGSTVCIAFPATARPA